MTARWTRHAPARVSVATTSSKLADLCCQSDCHHQELLEWRVGGFSAFTLLMLQHDSGHTRCDNVSSATPCACSRWTASPRVSQSVNSQQRERAGDLGATMPRRRHSSRTRHAVKRDLRERQKKPHMLHGLDTTLRCRALTPAKHRASHRPVRWARVVLPCRAPLFPHADCSDCLARA